VSSFFFLFVSDAIKDISEQKKKQLFRETNGRRLMIKTRITVGVFFFFSVCLSSSEVDVTVAFWTLVVSSDAHVVLS
jgi:hypothetical protein